MTDQTAPPPASPDATSSGGPAIVIVTGLSGAGRSTCLRRLEDRGFEAVDNMPLSLMPALLAPYSAPSAAKTERPHTAHPAPKIALGLDLRTRDFAAPTLLAMLEGVQSPVSIVFLDCDTDILIRRFTETRRRHPLAIDRPIADGIRSERRLLTALRARADLVIDTSHLSVPEFHTILSDRLGLRDADSLTVTVTSFGFRSGVPGEADMVFDVRFLRNPHYIEGLRAHDGRDPDVAAYIRDDAELAGFLERLYAFVDPLPPLFERGGKSYLTVAIGCTGGRHRSVFVAEQLAARLRKASRSVILRHRDLEEMR